MKRNLEHVALRGAVTVRMVSVLLAATLALSPVDVALSSPEQALGRAYAAYASLSPIMAGSGLDMIEAERLQRALVLNLRPRWGEVVGYKAALTAPAVRERFGVAAPVTGVLLENMFTTTGSVIDSALAVRPVLEADLLVRVGSEAINDATTRGEVLAALSEVIPFIEIPDLMYDDEVALTGPDIVAINAGARLGVVGEPVAIGGLDDALNRLAAFQVEVVDDGGRVVAEGEGTSLMGHPLDAALWLKNDLKRQGYRLKAGNLLSLGGMGPPVPIGGLERVTATYRGLGDRPLTIHVGFR
ncbi:MAG: hydratase [Proteobacteria bacterium]|nr:MAG: hydratase [Pseudomonadota bacterium]